MRRALILRGRRFGFGAAAAGLVCFPLTADSNMKTADSILTADATQFCVPGVSVTADSVTIFADTTTHTADG